MPGLIQYNLGIPASGNNPSTDQPNMLINNDNIAQYVAVDHVGFDADYSGQHKQVTFNNVTAPSTPADPISILYTKNDAFSHPQMNFLNSGAFANLAAASGSVLLMGGIIMQWGVGSLTGSGAGNRTFFATAFPHNCYVVVITGTDAAYAGGFVATALTTTTFNAIRTLMTGITGFNYIAIGN